MKATDFVWTMTIDTILEKLRKAKYIYDTSKIDL